MNTEFLVLPIVYSKANSDTRAVIIGRNLNTNSSSLYIKDDVNTLHKICDCKNNFEATKKRFKGISLANEDDEICSCGVTIGAIFGTDGSLNTFIFTTSKEIFNSIKSVRTAVYTELESFYQTKLQIQKAVQKFEQSSEFRKKTIDMQVMFRNYCLQLFSSLMKATLSDPKAYGPVIFSSQKEFDKAKVNLVQTIYEETPPEIGASVLGAAKKLFNVGAAESVLKSLLKDVQKMKDKNAIENSAKQAAEKYYSRIKTNSKDRLGEIEIFVKLSTFYSFLVNIHWNVAKDKSNSKDLNMKEAYPQDILSKLQKWWREKESERRLGSFIFFLVYQNKSNSPSFYQSISSLLFLI